MLRLLLFVGLCALESIQAIHPAPYQALTRGETLQIALECMEETQINRAVMKGLLKTVIIPKDKKYKEFLVCSYKKQGYLSQDGTEILHFNVVRLIKMYYDPTQFERLQLDRCKLIEAENAEELCFEYLKCILKGLED